MSGNQRSQSTHLTLRQRQKLRELEIELNIKDTASLVSAYNEASGSHENYDELLLWIKEYIPFFERGTHSECCEEAMEFAQLANITPKSRSETSLVQDAFNALCRKMHWGEYGEEKLIWALSCFLFSVDSKAFQGNAHHLTRLARDVMSKLGSEATFSRGTYPTYSVSLLTLQYLCAVIHEVDPLELDHGKQGGLFRQIDRCLENIINTQSYYPFCYQAILTRQSLASMDSNTGISSKEKRYRLFYFVRGTAYFYQALAEVVTLKVDFSCLEKGIEDFSEAFARHGIQQKHWYEIVQDLISFRMLVQKDPEELENFKDCLIRIDKIQESSRNKEDQLALRYTIIRQVTLLTLECPSEKIREWVFEEFFDFETSHAQRKGWAEDVRILEALLDAMLEIHQKGEFGDRMEKVIDRMKFYFKMQKQSKTINNWMSITRWRNDLDKKSKPDDKISGKVLFKNVKAKLSLDESTLTSDEVHRELQEKYERESEVPSLFDNHVSKHVQTLHHSLMLHKKERQNSGEETVKKTPIDLEDLFIDRELSSGESVKRVKQVFLLGNPGTGKTIIAKKIAYLWSIGEWGNLFSSLYLVPVRELVSINYNDLSVRTRRNLQTTITNICFPGKDDDEYEAIRQHVEESLNKDSTLVVFDGLDEGEEMTKEMMNSLESKSCRVLVLSRPRNLQSKKDSPMVEVECMGMDEAQLIEFIKLETSSNELVEHLQKHPSIWEISHVPVVANILTFLYNTKKEFVFSEESSLDMFSLYRKMSVEIWNRFVDKTKSNAEREEIFEALEEIAFNALEDGQILITQDLVHEISRNRQMRDVLRECGFLLLKKEGVVYQFPHLTFQEFFAGEYMAHSLMSKDDERRQRAIDFLTEHKYCANFRQMLCFMIQACIVKKGDRGYHEMELFIDATPIALAYHQHLVLNLELLEAALSASKKEDREKILNSTKVLEIALESSRRIVWGNRKFSYNPLVPFRNANMFASIINYEEIFDNHIADLFVKVAKVARYDGNQWEKIGKLLKLRASSGDTYTVGHCRDSVVRAIPEEKKNIEMLAWKDYDSDDENEREARMGSQSGFGTSMPNAQDGIHEAFEFWYGDESIDSQTSSNVLGHVKELPDRPQEIVMLMRSCDRHQDNLVDHTASLIRQFVRSVHERGDELMEPFQKWCDDDEDTKLEMIGWCTSIITSMPEYAQEAVEILWTLCHDVVHEVHDQAVKQLMMILLYSIRDGGPALSALMMLSENEPYSCRSSLVRLVAIAHRKIEGTQEDPYHLLSNLSLRSIIELYGQVLKAMRMRETLKIEEEMGWHLLHLLCLKALRPPEVKENELLKTINEADAFPNKVIVMSTKLMTIPTCPTRWFAPDALCRVADSCPEYKEEIFDSLEELMEDDTSSSATTVCILMISLLGKAPQRAERIMTRFEELIHLRGCSEFIDHMYGDLSLDATLKAYTECQSELLIPFIVLLLFKTPVTMETRSNGLTQLIVQTASDNKKKYSFKTDEDSEVFKSIIRKCTERRFQEVASSILY